MTLEKITHQPLTVGRFLCSPPCARLPRLCSGCLCGCFFHKCLCRGRLLGERGQLCRERLLGGHGRRRCRERLVDRRGGRSLGGRLRPEEMKGERV